MTGWRTKKRINAVILSFWGASLIITLAIPTQTYGNFVFNNTETTEGTWIQFMEGYPSVSYKARVDASTDGVFSVANPIHIKVRILNANITDLTSVYPIVMFTNSTKKIEDPLLFLKPHPDGGWFAEGNIGFQEELSTWMVLTPEPPLGGEFHILRSIFPNELSYIKSQSKIVTVGPASDTLALQFNSFAVKVAFVFGTFSIFLLAPILENIIIAEDDKKQSAGKQDTPGDKGTQAKKHTKEKQHDP